MLKVIAKAGSFGELAKVLGGSQEKARKVWFRPSFQAIADRIDRQAAVIWAFMQDQESCGRYGPKGAIVHTPQSIAAATGVELETVIGSVLKLIAAGHARINPDQTVKAA
jgi:hypothetical protein